jgi:hypothetical protein
MLHRPNNRPQDNRPHSSTTDKIGVAVDAAGVAADIAGTCPRLCFPSLLSNTFFCVLGTVVQAQANQQAAAAPPAEAGAAEAAPVRRWFEDSDELEAREFEELYARRKGGSRSKGGKGKGKSRSGSSKTDKVGVALDAANVAADIAGTITGLTQRDFEELDARDFDDELEIRDL